MDSHLLFKLAYVLYWIRSTIIHGERWLMEMLGQNFLHNISSYSPAKWTPTLHFVKMLLLTGKRLTRWSS